MPASSPRLETLEQEVLEANRLFYRAFAALDLEQMGQIWLHEDWVECVHPGWGLLYGWEEVRESWTRIFTNTERMKVEVSSVLVRVEGEVAWVVCTEHVTSTFEKGFDQAMVQATNIFVRRASPAGSRWHMVAHHASPLPPDHAPTLQ